MYVLPVLPLMPIVFKEVRGKSGDVTFKNCIKQSQALKNYKCTPDTEQIKWLLGLSAHARAKNKGISFSDIF